MPCPCIDQSKGCTDGYWCQLTQSHMDWAFSREYCSTSANYDQCPNYSGESIPQDALPEEVCAETLECFRNAVESSEASLCLLLQEIAEVIRDTGYEELIRFYNKNIAYSGVFDLPSASGRFQPLAVTSEDASRAQSLESSIDSMLDRFSPQNCADGNLDTRKTLTISSDDFSTIDKVIYSNWGAVATPFDEPDIDNICRDAAAGLFRDIKSAIEIFIYGLTSDLEQTEKIFDRGVERVRASAGRGGKTYGEGIPQWYDEI